MRMHAWWMVVALFSFAPLAAADPPEKAVKAEDKGGKEKALKSEKDKEKSDKSGGDKQKNDKDQGDKNAGEKNAGEKDAGEKKKPELPKVDKEKAKVEAKKERAALSAKVGKHLAKGKNPALTEELARHARRVAKLRRIAQVAEANQDAASEARAKKLLERENARHEKFMSGLEKSEKGGAK